MAKRIHGAALGALAVAAAVMPGTGARAGAVVNFGDDESLSIGLGIRTSFTAQQYGAPNGKSWSNDFNLDSVRLYISGSLNKYLKATFDTERTSDGNIEVLNGYIQIEPMDELNLWVGRMLPPSDRANLDGPYYLNTWLYPLVSQYPSKFDGRDDGATVWGKLADKKLVYSIGVFQGHDRVMGAANQSDNPLIAGRVAYNFWDPEPNPAYFESSTYYGAVDVLTLAFAGMHQTDGVGTIAHRGDYNAWNVDGLLEKKLDDAGVVTLEGAYYQYDTGGVTDVATNFDGAGPYDNVGGLTQGTAYLIGADYLFPGKVGWGRFQPALRFQEFDADKTDSSTKQYDIGVNYVIDGHNARFTLDYAHSETTGSHDGNEIVAGFQVQL